MVEGVVQELPKPIKSSQDVKDYKVIQLPNGLKALLVSDTSYDLEKLDLEEKSVMHDQDDDESDDEGEEEEESEEDEEGKILLYYTQICQKLA